MLRVYSRHVRSHFVLLKKEHNKTYFKLIKVISAILSGQTLHYAGHW